MTESATRDTSWTAEGDGLALQTRDHKRTQARRNSTGVIAIRGSDISFNLDWKVGTVIATDWQQILSTSVM